MGPPKGKQQAPHSVYFCHLFQDVNFNLFLAVHIINVSICGILCVVLYWSFSLTLYVLMPLSENVNVLRI